MYILYVDESGEPSNWANQKHFVMAGVAVHEGAISNLADNLEVVQKNYWPNVKVSVEFHAEHFKHSKGWVKTFSLALREQIMTDVYKLIQRTTFPSLVVFGAALSLDCAADAFQVRKDTFEEICSRFNNFLIWQHRIRHTSKCLVIIDKCKEDEYRSL